MIDYVFLYQVRASDAKSRELHRKHSDSLTNYFSPAPQAEPQAAGFSSDFASPAPHAEPHAPEGVAFSASAQR